MGDKGIDGKFQFCFGGFLFLIHRIILSLAAFLRHKDGQAVFPAQPVADVAYSVIGALVGNILVVVYKVYRTKNDVVMDMPFIYVSGKDVFILPLCYRVGKENDYPSNLSGGEQQRVAIARALAVSPEAILCDEPTGALDKKTGKQIMDLLHQVVLKNGIMLVIVTHDLDIAKTCNTIFEMDGGRLQCVKYDS